MILFVSILIKYEFAMEIEDEHIIKLPGTQQLDEPGFPGLPGSPKTVLQQFAKRPRIQKMATEYQEIE